MNKCCICVFNHKTILYDYEQLSLLRIIDFCITTNRLDDLIFIMPNSNMQSFKEFCKKYIDKYTINVYNNIYDFNCMPYNDICFSSVNAYNNMLTLNQNMYGDLGHSYDYMLVYQLDGYIFDDKLEYFLDKNYDYIGGYYLPMYVNHLIYNNHFNFDEHHLCMNGGVALRRISYCINSINEHYNELIAGCEFDNIHSYLNEDEFFSLFYNVKVEAIDSMKFSLNWAGAENHWAIINFEYPFCCHGIQHSKFLMKLIEKYNKEHNLDYIKFIE